VAHFINLIFITLLIRSGIWRGYKDKTWLYWSMVLQGISNE